MSKFRITLPAATLAASLVFAAASANAVVIDFESLKHEDALLANHGFTYAEDGYTLDSLGLGANPFVTWGTLESRFSGSTALFNNTNGGETRLTRTDSGVFSVQSIDLAELNGPNVASVTFTGTLSGGGTVMQSFSLDGIAFGAETFAFSGFSNLVSMSWN